MKRIGFYLLISAVFLGLVAGIYGCSDSDRGGYTPTAYPAGGILLVLDPSVQLTQAEVIYRRKAAEIIWEEFVVRSGHGPQPTEVHVRAGDKVFRPNDPTPYDGYWDAWNNVIVVPMGRPDLIAVYHELFHSHAPRQLSYDACHCHQVWTGPNSISSQQGEVLARIHRELGPMP